MINEAEKLLIREGLLSYLDAIAATNKFAELILNIAGGVVNDIAHPLLLTIFPEIELPYDSVYPAVADCDGSYIWLTKAANLNDKDIRSMHFGLHYSREDNILRTFSVVWVSAHYKDYCQKLETSLKKHLETKGLLKEIKLYIEGKDIVTEVDIESDAFNLFQDKIEMLTREWIEFLKAERR